MPLALFLAAPGLEALADSDEEFFERKVRPILADHCIRCHDSAGKRRGGLALDSREGWGKGGDLGPAIVPGDPDSSPLIQAVRWSDESLRMPPEEVGGRLSPGQVADLEAWVRRGAFDPRAVPASAPAVASWAEVFAERRKWWSLQPPREPPVPEPRPGSASSSPIDRFLEAARESNGVPSSGPADPRTLVRRATLVLTGLPPSSLESDAFAEASRRDPTTAYTALIDRLIASPRFGERFARHWLDVVRFTETHGNEWNYDVPYAWRYRDYLIRAFNEDVPYDQLVREHIAGDLLPNPRLNSEGRFNESVIGTAFYRFGEVNHDSCVEFGVIGYDIVDNQLDTLTKAFQATTVACARCHDHKLDAVSTRDYHALLGILRSTRSVQHTLDTPEVNSAPIERLKQLRSAIRDELAGLWERQARALDAATLAARLGPSKDRSTVASPGHPWREVADAIAAGKSAGVAWARLESEHRRERDERDESNRSRFDTVGDFRGTIEPGWTVSGMGLRDGASRAGTLVVPGEGEDAIRSILPAGLYTFGVSKVLNGALRSPTLPRTRGKVSFEVVGGGSSLARVVFNNCQLNYTNQHSIHHDDWTWVTVDFPKGTEELHPYAELLTFWDSPKFPDPLGTLGKDKENQRLPFDVHARDPRTWWGLRRIVAHDGPETPRADLSPLDRIYKDGPPAGLEDLAARYARIAAEAVEAIGADRASDDDVTWLNWLLDSGLLTRRADASPRLTGLVEAYRRIEREEIRRPTMMPGMADEGPGFAQPLLVRGDHQRPGEPVERRYLEALQTGPVVSPPEGSGRGDLAEQIASPSNPLTARVMVNRVWQWLFGRGLVGTPDDFGHLGELPLHPELLDYLATRFVRDGWSVKRLVRELALSAAFQADAAPAPGARARDPENRFFARYPARRAEAEVIRDTLLAVSGRLDGRLYGPSVHPFREVADTEKRLYEGPLDGDGRRSLYIKFQLMEAPRFLSAFNLPGGKVVQGRRDATNVPAQSLALLNDPFVLRMAEHWASRLVGEPHPGLEARLAAMFREALGRDPTPAELGRLGDAARRFALLHGASEGDMPASVPVWKDLAHALFNLKELIYIP